VGSRVGVGEVVVDGWVGRRVTHTSPFNLTFSSSYRVVSYYPIFSYAIDANSHYTAHTTSPILSSLYNSLALHTT